MTHRAGVRRWGLGIGLLAGLVASAPAAPPTPAIQAPAGEKDPQVGQTFRVPYRRTLTNHYLVRVRINGKGPFNLLVDTGAPALFLGSKMAAAAGLAPDAKQFWTPVDRMEIEGGAVLTGVKARVEDLFQLEGMNALGLPGASIDGVMGFTVLARYRMEFDPRSDRMNWTRLDFQPRDPFVPRDADARRAPAEVEAMNLLGPAMKLASLMLGKQPPDTLLPQGRLGIVLAAPAGGDPAQAGATIAAVWPGSPAEAAGLKAGDRIATLGDDDAIASPAEAHEAIAKIRPGATVRLSVRRGEETVEVTVTAEDGL